MRRAIGVLAISFLLLATPTSAQLDAGFGPDLSLEIFPQHPAPGDVVRVVAQSTLIPLSEATITWYVDGKKVSETGSSEKELTAGSLGSETVVTVSARSGNDAAEASVRIRPTEMDLLWESDSYVPPFFRGRALPSAGTTLKMEAVPRFKLKSGAFVSPGTIIFTWKRNGYVIEKVSGRGRSRAVIPAPGLFGTDTISVEARTMDGTLAGESSTVIRSVEPRLLLYENHPLFGIKYHAAFGTQSFVDATEVTLAATPYYADTPTPDALTYEWKVNGQPIGIDPEKPSALTLNAAGSSGIALIDLALSSATNFYLSAQNAWRITLLGSGGGSAQDPFGR